VVDNRVKVHPSDGRTCAASAKYVYGGVEIDDERP
jgi:hypothetical protein